MQGVVQRGTGASVNAVGKPIAGKTGTTSDWRDAWFVGFTPDLAAGVYVGYDDHSSLGRGEQAARVSAPIFRDFMTAALKNAPPTEFRIPPGLRLYRVDPNSGLPAEGGGPSIYEAFKPGTEPGKDQDFGLRGVPGEADMSQLDADVPGASAKSQTPGAGTGGLY
jgi:penicillin-binding protein 1A